MSLDPIYTSGIQKALNEKANQRLDCDGQFGGKSVAALKLYQQQSGLAATGVYDDATSATLDTFIKGKYLTFDSIKAAAEELQVTPAHVRTVCGVESNGAGFLPDGRVKILFERHKFLESLKKNIDADQIESLKVTNPDIVSATPGGYVGNAGEYPRFLRAQAIDLESAYYGTSYGLFQIMGFNFKACGYDDLTSFYTAMTQSETNQLLAFVEFNKTYANGKLWHALQTQDWVTYALTYNGSAYQKNQYDAKLSSNFIKYSKDIFAY